MAYRNRVTTAPALVNGVVETTNAKRNGSIFTLQNKMETTSQWLDDAILSAKRKIVEGTNVPIQDIKKAKTIGFKRDDGAPLSPICDKENSPNQSNTKSEASPLRQEQVRMKVKPPPSAVKRKVNGMRVVDLRKELKSKGIESKGLKKDLQQRLLQAYTTVEKIMSPAKDKPDPPADDEKHPDTASVEVIVFSSSSDEDQIMQDDTKLESKQEEQTESTTPMPEVEADVEKVQQPMKVEDKKESPSNMETTSEKGEAESGEGKAMDIDEAEKPVPVSANNSATSIAPPIKRRGSMAMGSTKMSKDLTVLDAGVPKASSSEEPVSSSNSSLMGQQQGPDDEKKASVNQDQRPVPTHSSRKVSQDSIASVRSQQSASSNENSAAVVKVTTEATHGDEAAKDPQESSTQARSPVRRVQAAIQLFTSKSASKPISKPMPTPSKLAWLNKAPQSMQKLTAITAMPQIVDQEPAKEQENLGSSLDAQTIKRPYVGLQSAASAASNSALKPSRFLTKANETNEARKARIAEMRQKSKPVITAKPAFATTKDISAATAALSSKNQALSTAADDKESKRKLLTAQMREKAAARKKLEMAATEDANKQNTETIGLKQDDSASKVAPPSADGSNVTSAAAATAWNATSAAQQTSEPSAKPKTPIANKEEDYLGNLRPQLLSPMDTYEISDREDSDSEDESESEDEDDEKPRKKIPDWAQRANLLPALEKQFADGPDRCDPDEIFSEVQTCDLQAIFNSKRTRYVRRTSSGNWTKDKVTAMEKLSYKRAMGYSNGRK